MSIRDIENIILQKTETEYKAFTQRLVATSYEVSGMRLPDIKQLALRVVSGEFGDPIEIVGQLNNSYEKVMLQALVIARLKLPDEERVSLVTNYVSRIDNWAHCDTFVCASKFMAKNRSFWKPVVQSYALGTDEFSIRFGIVSLMSYFLTPEYCKETLEIAVAQKNDAYYVKMAVAWLVATAMAKCREPAIRLITENKLEPWTHNKSIQKAIESYRVSAEDKAYLRTLRIKSV